MVGSVDQAGPAVRAAARSTTCCTRSRSGDYLGQNYGKITKITETDIALREIVQDAAGEWIERTSALQLQEKAR